MTANLKPASAGTPAAEEARRRLGGVLRWLALLDVTVVVIVVSLAVAMGPLHMTTAEFLAGVLTGVGAVLAARIALAVRLRRAATVTR